MFFVDDGDGDDTYTYIHIHTHTYTYIYIHIQTYTYIHIHTVVHPGIQENLFPYQLIWDSCLAAKSLLCFLYLMIIISRCMLLRSNCKITSYDSLSFAIPLCNCCSGQCKVTAGGGGQDINKKQQN